MPGTPLHNLSLCDSFIKNFQTEVGTKYRYARPLNKLSMFVRKKDYPKLRGKGAELMDLGPAFLALWSKYMKPILVHKQIKLVLKLNDDMEKVLRDFSPKDGFFAVPEPEAMKLREISFSMAALHVQLSEHFAAENVKVLNVTPKTQSTLHSAYLAVHVHPHLLWCYKGEDMMGKVSALLKSCLRGRSPTHMASAAALKYRLALHLAFQKMQN